MSNTIRFPGLMDPHVHLRGMDWSHKGDFHTETSAALAGGYTLVLDMPNTSPPTTTVDALRFKLSEIGSQAVCDWGIYFGASQSDNTDQFAAAFQHVCGIKIYCNATTGNLLVEDQALRRRIYHAWPHGKVIAVHAEGPTVLEILELVRATGKHTHFCHISTADEIAALTSAKAEGLPISIGVCPHHLYLTEADLPTLGPYGLMKPELKTIEDQRALWHAVTLGVVDVIESDHAPHTRQEKESDNPPYGVPGLETSLPLMLLAIEERGLTLEHIAELMTLNARRIFDAPPDADTYTLVDLDESSIIHNSAMFTKAGWSPFAGKHVRGRILEVTIRGTKAFDGSTRQVLVDPGFGLNRFATGAPA